MSSEIVLNGNHVKHRSFKFDTSVIKSDDIDFELKHKIVHEFIFFLEK